MEHTGLCPMCGNTQVLDETGFHSVSVDERGVARTIITLAYHCRSCGVLVRHEHLEESPVETGEAG